jgi:hypothetical protein
MAVYQSAACSAATGREETVAGIGGVVRTWFDLISSSTGIKYEVTTREAFPPTFFGRRR